MLCSIFILCMGLHQHNFTAIPANMCYLTSLRCFVGFFCWFFFSCNMVAHYLSILPLISVDYTLKFELEWCSPYYKMKFVRFEIKELCYLRIYSEIIHARTFSSIWSDVLSEFDSVDLVYLVSLFYFI